MSTLSMTKRSIVRPAALTGVCILGLIAGARAQDNATNADPGAQTTSPPSPSLGEVTLGVGGLTESSADLWSL